jgi:hypothetical protein
MQTIHLAENPSQSGIHWPPHMVGAFIGHDLMVVKVPGEFVWHDHPDTDDSPTAVARLHL